jgi:hypothetical protein
MAFRRQHAGVWLRACQLFNRPMSQRSASSPCADR